MKSKKLVALALTAAMAISMASMTAFAGVSYNDNATLETLTAKVSLSDSEIVELKATITEGKEIGATAKGDTATVSVASLKDLRGDDYVDLDTSLKDFTGWNVKGSSGADVTPLTEVTVTKGDDGNWTADLEACWKVLKTEKEIDDHQKVINDIKAGKEADAKLDETLKKLDEKYNAAGDNGQNTKTLEYLHVVGKEVAPDTADFRAHALKVADVDDNDKAFVFNMVAADKDGNIADLGVRTGFTARTTFNVKTPMDLTKCNITVYHIEGWCKAKKVKVANVTKNTVTVYADSFSPFVVVATPGDNSGAGASTGTNNPGTGDFSAVPVALLAAAALGATGFVAYKKRKAE